MPAVARRLLSAESRAILLDIAKWDGASQERRRQAAAEVADGDPSLRLVRAETFSCGELTHEVWIFVHVGTRLEFVLVPGGVLHISRGSLDTSVLIRHPFLIARTECTQDAYVGSIGTNPSHWTGSRLPVENVSWHDAAEFCERTGMELPSEAEWECRTHEVGQKLPNALGLFDVHGNVSEWCSGGFADFPRATLPAPPGGWSAAKRVFRGGGFEGPSSNARAWDWGLSQPDARDRTQGFRPVRRVLAE